MALKPKYTPSELQTLFTALNAAPNYISKRFVLTALCGWDESMINENVRLRNEEEAARKNNNRVAGWQ